MLCSKCGAETAEESVFCNKCGTKLSDEADFNINTETNIVGVVNETVLSEKPHFNEVNVDNKKLGKKSKINFIILLLIIIIIGGFSYKQQSNKKIEQYRSDLMSVVSDILEESIRAEQMTNTYSDVWSRIIKSDYSNRVKIDGKTAYDFNTGIALQRNLFQKDGKMKTLQDGKALIESKMKLLNLPPDKYKEAYEIAFEMYGYYTEYESLAESPTGSLVTFNQKTNELSSAIVKKSEEFQIKMPSK